MTSEQYTVWPNARRNDGVISLRSVEIFDIEPIRRWRNAQMDVLRQNELITVEAQEAYFAAHVWPQKERKFPTQIIFAIERDETLIGYGGLVHISWPNRQAEISFLLSPAEEAGENRENIFYRFLRIIQSVAFRDLALLRLHTETYAHRTSHIATLENAGLRLEERLCQKVEINGEPVDSLIHGIVATEWNTIT